MMSKKPMYPTDAFLRNWLKILLTIFTIALWVLMFAALGVRVASGQAIPDSQVARLWHDGNQLSQEVVACLGEDRIGPTMTDTANATIGSIPAERSLQLCAPPTWIGTVHTHPPGCIRTPMGPCVGGWSAFSTPGSSDRAVAREWERRHGRPGRFCVVHHLGRLEDALVLGLTCWSSNEW